MKKPTSPSPLVVVSMDSFKGCLGSMQAAAAVRRGVQRACPGARIIMLPGGDGGEGSSEAIAGKGSRTICTTVTGPCRKPVEACWQWSEASRQAVIDLAAASGLTLLPTEKRNPLRTTTYGTGQLIAQAIAMGARHIILGLGGSATNDAALGALQALGIEVKMKGNQAVPPYLTGNDLSHVESLRVLPGTPLSLLAKGKVELVLACDVDTPFVGRQGAVAVFAPQKGATPADLALLEKGMEHMRAVYMQASEVDVGHLPGAGAAGGCGGGFMAMARGTICRGAQLVLKANGLAAHAAGAALVITGEGSADRQTLSHKYPYEVLLTAKGSGNVPVVLLAGRVADAQRLLDKGFDEVACINEGYTQGNPICPDTAAHRLETTAFMIGKKYLDNA